MSRRDMLMEALQATPRDLARTLRRVTPEQAALRPAPGAWSVAEVAAHMVEMEERFLGRLRQIIAEDNPTVAPLDPDEARHELARPLHELMQAFTERRAETVAFLRTLEQAQWGRPLVHPTGGPTRFREQVQALVGHDNDHLAQIAAIREVLEASQ